MDERLTDLEEKFAYLERYVEQLDETVRELFDKLEGIRADISRAGEETAARLTALEEGEQTLEDERPPHWG